VIFEVVGVPRELAKQALALAAQKLPVVTKFVTNRRYVEVAE
jgi:large subunit ribosomal protein L16